MPEIRKMTYHAQIGGVQEHPLFCTDANKHPEHLLLENAAACLPAGPIGNLGKVYEEADGVFTDAFWSYEKRGDGKKYSQHKNGSPYKGKKRSEF